MNRCEEIKKEVSAQLQKIVSRKDVFIEGLTNSEAYGHSAGTPLETWVKSRLQEEKWQVFFPNEFLLKFFDNLKEKRKILEFLDSTWWGKLLFTPNIMVEFG